MTGRVTSVRRKARSGFTLLEVLTATVMFAVIMSALYSVFHGALHLRETAYDAFEKNVPKDYVVEIIKRDLANITVPNGILASVMIGERGEKGSLSLDRLRIHTVTGAVTDRDPWADIQRVEYSLEAGQGAAETGNQSGQSLVRSVTRNLLAPTEENPETQSLLEGVQSLKLTYYDGQDWLDSWDSTVRNDSTDTTTLENVLPLAIEVRIDFVPPEPGQRETLPIELVVPVAAKAVVSGQQQQGTTLSPTSKSSGKTGGTAGTGTTGSKK